MRLHPTPLRADVPVPPERPGAPLTPLLDAVIPAPGLADLLPALADPDLTVVTTGQQAGLFTGPLYTIHKALSAAALADRLSRRWGRPVRAVFWVAGDDHDFAEAASTCWVDEAGNLREVHLPARHAEAPMQPMYREPLGAAVEPLLERFAAALPEMAHRRHVADWLGRHYRAEATIAGAFGSAMAELLTPLGIACLDSTHPVFKAAAGPILLEALTAAAPLDQALGALGARYEAAGDTPPVVVGDGASLVFLEDRLGRDRLVRDEGGFVTRRGGDRYSLAELARIADREPQRLSPSVLLRPVVESAVLPTVAYAGGPGELRYLEMTGPIYDQLGVWRQAPVPRWSGVIVEPHVERILAKFGATVEEAMSDPAALERQLLRSRLPQSIGTALRQLQEQADRLHDELEPAALGLDPTLAGPIANSRRQMQWAARDLEKRIFRRMRAREAVELAQLRRIKGALLPDGHPQERVLNVAPFLARHGTPLLGQIRDAAREWYGAALEGAASPA